MDFLARLFPYHLLWILILLGISSSCKPGGKNVDKLFGADNDVPTKSNFAHLWNFSVDSEYEKDATVDVANGLTKLAASPQNDASEVCHGFGDGFTPNCGGTFSGVTWDTSAKSLRLGGGGGCTGTTTSCAGQVLPSLYEIDLSWTPKHANIIQYMKLNGSGPVAHSQLITATIGIDSQAKNPNGTSLAYIPGKIGQGMIFDGTDHMQGLNPPFTFPANSYSISGWFKTTVTGERFGLFNMWDPTFAYTSIFFNSDNELYFENSDSAFVYILVKGGSLQDGKWHHFVAVRDAASSTMYLYADGKLIGSEPDLRTGTLNGTGGFDFGKDTSAQFKGSLDEFVMWNTALTADEVTTIYNRQSVKFSGVFTSRVMDGLTSDANWKTLLISTALPFLKELPDAACTLGPTCSHGNSESSSEYSSLVGSTGLTGANDLMTGIQGLWHLNEVTTATAPSGKDFKDDSGNGNDATLAGAYTLGIESPLKKGIDFKTTGSFSVPASFSTNFATDFTLSMWAYPTQATGTSYVLAYSENPGVNGFRLELSDHASNGFTSWAFSALDSGGSFRLNAGAPATINEWTHVTISYKRSTSTARLYINGLQVGVTAGTLIAPTQAFTIGTGAGNPFKGKADELAVWSRTLHPNEIHQLYRRGANRIKYQVRTCTSADCSDDPSQLNWKGENGSALSTFTELNNNTSAFSGNGDVKKTKLNLLFSNYSGFSTYTDPLVSHRYFQYRSILESNDVALGCTYEGVASICSPEIKFIEAGPNHFDKNPAAIVTKKGRAFISLAGFSEILGASCSSGISYNLGVGSSSNGATWYWHDGTSWVVSDGTDTQSNDAVTVTASVALWGAQVGPGNVFVRAFLRSDGESPCELSGISLDGSELK